jgi:hypothetical protein
MSFHFMFLLPYKIEETKKVIFSLSFFHAYKLTLLLPHSHIPMHVLKILVYLGYFMYVDRHKNIEVYKY